MIQLKRVVTALRKWSNLDGRFTSTLGGMERHCAIGGLAKEAGLKTTTDDVSRSPSLSKKLQAVYGLTEAQMVTLQGVNDGYGDTINGIANRRKALVNRVTEWHQLETKQRLQEQEEDVEEVQYHLTLVGTISLE